MIATAKRAELPLTATFVKVTPLSNTVGYAQPMAVAQPMGLAKAMPVADPAGQQESGSVHA